MALAVATVALAGVLYGARSSFDPFVGPTRLIYAFEAVIIGGLGSLWGTLAGGIILGVSQSIGRQIDPQWGELAGHARVPDRPRRSGRPASSARVSCDERRVRVIPASTSRSPAARWRARFAVVVLAVVGLLAAHAVVG